jgi:hypothetical protein
MPKNKIIISLAALIALLPLLGFPGKAEAFFQVLAGVGIILLMVWSNIDKKLSQRAKAALRRRRKDDIEATLDERAEDRRQMAGTILDREEFVVPVTHREEDLP